jgi:hypothetical protein
MNLNDVARQLDLKVIAPPSDTTREVCGGYASDLLSCVMARAGAGALWITLQSHPNIVAVAALLDLAGIIITENSPIDPATATKATEEGVALYASPLTTYSVIARLVEAGIRGVDM